MNSDPRPSLNDFAKRARRYSINLNGRVVRDESRLIRGGFAFVYKGTLLPEKTEVAIKTARGGLPGEERLIKRALKEMHLWSKIRHENVLPLIGITTEYDLTISIVSRWMQNGNAREYVQEKNRDPRPLIMGIAEGLRYLHNLSRAVVHGDLKGANVLISDDGKALLTDFGLSSITNSSFSLSAPANAGGSIHWMAPEILEGNEKSTQGDLWALGMTALELFTRKDPFHDVRNGVHAIMIRVMKGPPNRPSDADTCYRMTEQWWNIFLSCWNHDASKRPTISQVLSHIFQIDHSFAQPDYVPAVLSRKLEEQAQVESSPSKDDRSLQQMDVTAHPGTLGPEEAKTIVNPSHEHSHSGLPDPIAPLTALARLASEYCLNLNGLVSLDNHHLLRNRYATTRSGDLHQKDYAKGIGGDSSGTGQSTKVAIKTLRGKLPGDLDSIKRFLGEVHVWSKLQHQNILAPLGLTTEFEQTVSVVSLWRGNARDYVQDKTIDPRPLIEGIAQGMDYLHNHQPTAILHGHLKGANVVISDDGQALLTDFGFSDIVSSTSSMTPVSQHGEEDMIDWMSPEMFKFENVSAEADVWAFGMTVLELFTRQNPFHHHAFDTLSVAIAQGHLPERPSAEDACSRMTDTWWDMCSRCWRYDPSSRPTMAHIIQEIGTMMSPASSTLDNFTSLASPYTIEPIERGGTASTSGSNTVEGRMANGIKVAVKTLRYSPPGDTDDIERVLNDISTWCKLRHDNILPVLGITTKFDNAVSVVSLWMQNGNAHDYVRNNDVSPVPLLVGVASGLRYLHGQHIHPIYHGNLRGHNILISQGGQALLTDFGLSKLIGSPSFNPRLVNWTSPEHLDDFKGSPEGDVWAFGMTALELFTRSFPFHDIQDVKQRIVEGPPGRPSDCTRLTDKWWEIFSSCWKYEPQLRPSIGEMIRRVAQEHFVGLWLRGNPDVWRLFQNMF